MTALELWRRHAAEDTELAQQLSLIEKNDAELSDCFGSELKFGTAGLRAKMGVGPNRMNIYTVRLATQALANYLSGPGSAGEPSVAIAYDTRRGSLLFAQEAACVLAANNIRVHIFREPMPVPVLSYAVRELGAAAGIVITASHNPAEYNGYKVYGPDGGQCVSESAEAISAEMAALNMFEDIRYMPYSGALAGGRVEFAPNRLVESYLKAVQGCRLRPGICRDSGLKVIYTPLCGAGLRCVMTSLELAGACDIALVPGQSEPDPAFAACLSPNPERPEAMAQGMQLQKLRQAHLLLATDPDCDRVGVAVLHGGEPVLLTGNEIGVLLLDYIARTLTEQGRMPKGAVYMSSIVSTQMADEVARRYGVKPVRLLTGFKYIGQQLTELANAGEEQRFVLGFEESHGYLTGSHVRDKDAVNACVLIAEMAAYHLGEGHTLIDVLQALRRQYGYYLDTVQSVELDGPSAALMSERMAALRAKPPQGIAGRDVMRYSDHLVQLTSSPGGTQPTGLPQADVLEYRLTGGARVVIRPSGTEPKLKIYYSTVGDSHGQAAAEQQLLAQGVALLLGL